MTDPTPTRDQMMMDLSEKASTGMTSVLVEKQNKRDLIKGKLDNLKRLRKDEIKDENEHNKRIAGFKNKLDDLDKDIEPK